MRGQFFGDLDNVRTDEIDMCSYTFLYGSKIHRVVLWISAVFFSSFFFLFFGRGVGFMQKFSVMHPVILFIRRWSSVGLASGLTCRVSRMPTTCVGIGEHLKFV